MANIEHSTISDAQRHECKGTSTALAGAYQRADGAGVATWVQTHGIYCALTTAGSYSAGSWNDIAWDVTLVSNGVTRSGASITIARSGVYIISYGFQVTASGGSGTGSVRVLKNGTEIQGSAHSCTIPSGAFLPLQTVFGAELTAGDVLKYQLYPANTYIALSAITYPHATYNYVANMYVYSLPS